MIKTIKWIAIDTININEVSNAMKTAISFAFVDEICFFLAHLHFKCNLNNLK